MRSKLIITLMTLVLSASAFPVMAHDGNFHASDVETIVSGVGIIIITIAVASLFIKKHDNTTDDSHQPED